MTHLSRSQHTALALATAVAVAMPAAPATVRAQTLQRRVDTTFAVDRNAWLDVGIVDGTIVVTGWTRAEARIVAHTDNGYIEGTYSRTRIGIDVRSDRGSRSRNHVGPAYIEVSVPVGTRVMASAVNGSVRVRGTGAEVQASAVSGNVEVVDAADRVVARTISGDLRLERIRGRTSVGTTSGELELDSITGALDIDAVSSDMRIRRVESSDVRIGTTSGDITYEGSIDPKGSYELTTHSGDVHFEIPTNTGATLSLQTFSGDIDSAFPMTLQPGANLRRQRGQRMEFSIGGGGARVAITTFSGDITIARGPARAPRED